ncbi:unnamed protein product [Cladocopium goreaui]|uniref:Trichohyalin n=1 Tax=Cladocopium goreaui TaxID=2562237 RepID=A0A9P1FVF4_9DINO|nr:unnamed protein product [Cladocopium goreaui]
MLEGLRPGHLTDRSYDRPRGEDVGGSASQRERLLRGESTYTTSSGMEHFIEDQPQLLQYGMTHLLPKASTTEERERLLRRLEMCAKAREESTKIMSIRFAQRDAVKHDMKQDRRVYLDRLLASQRERDERWARRLQKSPFAIDLVAEDQRISEENRVRQLVEQRRAKSTATRSREAHHRIFKRATAESDELDQLRREKRTCPSTKADPPSVMTLGDGGRPGTVSKAPLSDGQSLIEKLLGKALSDDALAKLRSLFTKETAEPVRGTALLPGSVCYCFQDVRKEKEVDQPQMQPVVLLPPESDHQGSHRFCLVGGLPPLPKKVYRVRWSSLCPIDECGAVRDVDAHFRHYRILWRRPGCDEDELVELLPPSDGMCQIAAVDGVHVVNPDEITWNRSMPKRCD